ncbi:GDP-mannose 4,6-dehydratase [Quadrisphaera setariae]|uniref:GDP-mannose 4,6-dehydratase n=1 Tax=Quadrisphaera setariae TaxID=2593304 RepID=A0A5C8ZLL7_9ACTN|nr:GDP-mannose 4,6-dehydratase [Quadrisphaera setariae]TXR58063.1 GDP-mannose 4,6-dehydratase [Quadrisphaera setariae]
MSEQTAPPAAARRVALVTGLTGQDGGYLAELLAAEGTLVHGVRRGSGPLPPHLEALGDRLVVHTIDLLDPGAADALVRDVRPDEVYNLAAESSVARSWEEPVETALLNAVLPAALLHAAEQTTSSSGGQVRVLQASSAEVYAGSGVTPQDESTPVVPTNPYGAAKAYAHHLVQAHRAGGAFAVNAVLYPHESPRRPARFVTRKITSTVAAIARGRADELVLGNTAARRDWGWAPDTVRAMVAALRHTEPLDLVVATGTSHSVEEFVAAAFARAGVAEWLHLVRTDPAFVRPNDAADLVGDPTLAREALGWAPTVPFADVVGAMVDADLALLDA